MAAELQIADVIILSIDKSEESWEIEGEIIFDDNLTTAFAVTYLPDEESEDALEDLSLEINPGNINKAALKDKIIDATLDYDE